MKTLLILRHAKSSWKDADRADHDRPLNKRGKCDAPKMGSLLREIHLTPDRIVSSTAVRARDTAARVAEQAGFDGAPECTDALYLATPEEILRVLRQVSDAATRVMVVGHNPGLEQLLALLTGHDLPLPTAALAQIEIEITHWAQLDSQSHASLVELWRPRELD